MIERIELQHFKCFERLTLPLAPVTVLTGTNAAGKSSVIQALALLHQTATENEWSNRLFLNGNTLALGRVTDVVDKLTGRGSFSLALQAGPTRVEWRFDSSDRRDLSMPVGAFRWEDGGPAQSEQAPFTEPFRYLFPDVLLGRSERARALATYLRDLNYVGAERVGPREIYPLGDPAVQRTVGVHGEHAAGLLHWRGDENVHPALRLTAAPPTLRRQVEARLGAWFPGATLAVEVVPNTNAVALGLRLSDATDFHRPQHVGYGLTHILPILVAGLSANGATLIVENPEAHLHPAAQAAVARFLCEVAGAGSQVLIETHSDHVVNGIRRAVLGRTLRPEQVAIHFFRAERAFAPAANPQVETLRLDSNGRLDAWPAGFFDQIDMDTAVLAGWED